MGIDYQLVYRLDLSRLEVDNPRVIAQVNSSGLRGVVGAGINIDVVSASA
jgi:NADH:ubiquinone oxidoreductase subunit F (NADH-binding)